MPLLKFTYQPSITGSIIDTSVKAATSIMDPNSPDIGKKCWEEALKVIYQDFDLTLAMAIDTFLQQGTVMFPATVPPMQPLPYGPTKLSFSGLCSGSASSIDSKTKAITSAMVGPASAAAGKMLWIQAFQQIYIDMLNTIPNPIASGMNSCVSKLVVQTMPGYLPPIKPQLIVPYMAPLLTTVLFALFNPAMALIHGMKVDTQIKGITSSLSGQASSTAGAKAWQVFLDDLVNQINIAFNTVVRLFIIVPGMNYWLPPAMAFTPPLVITPNPPIPSKIL